MTTSIQYDRMTDKQSVLNNMVEIEFTDNSEQGFRKVKETLERMGIPKKHDKILFQTAHVLHKKNRYYICHFLELFALDGRQASLNEGDLGRRNLIIKYLVDWGLVRPVEDNWKSPMASPRVLKVLRHEDREEWTLSAKYAIGVKKGV